MRVGQLIVVGALLTAIAGCGEDGSGEAAAPPGPRQVVRMEAVEFSRDWVGYTEENPIVKPGRIVLKMRNPAKNSETHALAVEKDGEELTSPPARPGDRTTLTVDLPERGRYMLYCPLDNHRHEGMWGYIRAGVE